MRIIRNTGTERVIDLVRPGITPEGQLDLVSPTFSLFAFEALREQISSLSTVRVVVPKDASQLQILGSDGEPLGAFAITTTDAEVGPGTIFCLRAEGEAKVAADAGYPLAPHYLVHVGTDGVVALSHPQAKQILDHLKRATVGRDLPDSRACATFDQETKDGEEMRDYQAALAAAIASITGKGEARAVESLFTPGGTHAGAGEFAGADDFEVVAFLVVLPGEPT